MRDLTKSIPRASIVACPICKNGCMAFVGENEHALSCLLCGIANDSVNVISPYFY